MIFHVVPLSTDAMLLKVIMMMSLMLTEVDLAHCCDLELGCCNKANHGSGVLNTTSPIPGFDTAQEGNAFCIHQCVKYYTSFQWYKIVNGFDVAYPWENSTDRVKMLGDFNQTIGIVNTEMRDSAVYKFVAKQGTQQVTGTYQLHVYCKEDKFMFRIKPEPKVQHVELHAKKTLRCAAYFRCNYSERKPKLFWKWHPDNSENTMIRIDNATFKNVRVSCDTGSWVGNDCTLTIASVEKELFSGELACQALGQNMNSSVRLEPREIETENNKFILVGVVVAAVLILVCVCICVFIIKRYGDYLCFRFKTAPSRGNFLHDAVVVYGDDLKNLVCDTMEPKLTEFGYDVKVYFPAGRFEMLDQTEAILNAYCVILAFSSEEMQELPEDFLTKILMKKSFHTILFIRFHETCALNNVWKSTRLKRFKVLDWPGDMSVSNDVNAATNHSRKMDSFWYKLRNKLPKPSKTQRRNGHCRQNEVSSASSTHPLLTCENSERIGSITSNHSLNNFGLSHPMQSNGLESGQVDESGFHSLQEHFKQETASALSVAHGLSDNASSQPCNSSDYVSSHPNVVPPSTSLDLFGFSDLTSQDFSSQSPFTAAMGQMDFQDELGGAGNTAQQQIDATGLHHQSCLTNFVQCRDDPDRNRTCDRNLIDFDGASVPNSSSGTSKTDAAAEYHQTDCAGGRVPKGRESVKGLEIRERCMGFGDKVEGGSKRFETQESGYHSLSPSVNATPYPGQQIVPPFQPSMSAMLRRGESSQ